MFIKLFLLLLFCSISVCCGDKQRKQSLSQETAFSVSKSAININTATASELENIPQIGKKTAEAIILHREKFGRFRKAEHLMLVPRISEKRFREMRPLIKVD